MARPIGFDRPKAVNRALVLFWRKGYQASSMADLLAAMRISRSSFYAAFTDKRALFIECLDLFAARAQDALRLACTEMPPVDALQWFVEYNVGGARGAGPGREHWGCLLVNTVLEMAGVDEALVARASEHQHEVQRLFQTSLEQAGAAPGLAEELAAVLMRFMEGVRVASRRRLPEAQLRQPIAATFKLLRSALA